MTSTTHSPAPIRSRPLHDAHVLAILMLFFIGVAFPVAWHTVVAWSLAMMVLAKIQGMTWRAIMIRFGLALLLSWSIWLWNMIFVAERTDETLQKANQILLRVTTMTWVALMSGTMVALRHATRGAMSLRARGLAEHEAKKIFYYDYQSTRRQQMTAWLTLLILLAITVTSEWLRRYPI